MGFSSGSDKLLPGSKNTLGQGIYQQRYRAEVITQPIWGNPDMLSGGSPESGVSVAKPHGWTHVAFGSTDPVHKYTALSGGDFGNRQIVMRMGTGGTINVSYLYSTPHSAYSIASGGLSTIKSGDMFEWEVGYRIPTDPDFLTGGAHFAVVRSFHDAGISWEERFRGSGSTVTAHNKNGWTYQRGRAGPTDRADPILGLWLEQSGSSDTEYEVQWSYASIRPVLPIPQEDMLTYNFRKDTDFATSIGDMSLRNDDGRYSFEKSNPVIQFGDEVRLFESIGLTPPVDHSILPVPNRFFESWLNSGSGLDSWDSLILPTGWSRNSVVDIPENRFQQETVLHRNGAAGMRITPNGASGGSVVYSTTLPQGEKHYWEYWIKYINPPTGTLRTITEWRNQGTGNYLRSNDIWGAYEQRFATLQDTTEWQRVSGTFFTEDSAGADDPVIFRIYCDSWIGSSGNVHIMDDLRIFPIIGGGPQAKHNFMPGWTHPKDRDSGTQVVWEPSADYVLSGDLAFRNTHYDAIDGIWRTNPMLLAPATAYHVRVKTYMPLDGVSSGENNAPVLRVHILNEDGTEWQPDGQSVGAHFTTPVVASGHRYYPGDPTNAIYGGTFGSGVENISMVYQAAALLTSTPGDTWRTLSGTFITPPAGAVPRYFGINLVTQFASAGDDGASVWVDNLELEQVDLPELREQEFERFRGQIRDTEMANEGGVSQVKITAFDQLTRLEDLEIQGHWSGTTVRVERDYLMPALLSGTDLLSGENRASVWSTGNFPWLQSSIPSIREETQQGFLTSETFEFESNPQFGQIILSIPITVEEMQITSQYSYLTKGMHLEDLIEDIFAKPDGFGFRPYLRDYHLKSKWSAHQSGVDILTPNLAADTLPMHLQAESAGIGGGDYARLMINDIDYSPNQEGSFNLVAINSEAKVFFSGAYFLNVQADINALSGVIHGLESGVWVMMATRGSVHSDKLPSNIAMMFGELGARQHWRMYSGSLWDQLEWYHSGSWAFIGQKGKLSGVGIPISEVISNAGKDPAVAAKAMTMSLGAGRIWRTRYNRWLNSLNSGDLSLPVDVVVDHQNCRLGAFVLSGGGITTGSTVRLNRDYDFATMQATGIEMAEYAATFRNATTRLDTIRNLRGSVIPPNYIIRTEGKNIWGSFFNQSAEADYDLTNMINYKAIGDEDVFTRVVIFGESNNPKNLVFDPGVRVLSGPFAITGSVTDNQLVWTRNYDPAWRIYSAAISGVGRFVEPPLITVEINGQEATVYEDQQFINQLVSTSKIRVDYQN